MKTQQLSLFQLDSDSSSEDSIYVQLDDFIPNDLPNKSYISLDRVSPLKVYSLGFQPAKTIPEIPAWFLQKYTKPDATILEPFAGSGTSIIEALKLKRNVFWLDYNPLSQLICQVKTNRIVLNILSEKYLKILNQAQQEIQAQETVQFKNKDFWFQKPVEEGLEILRKYIFETDLDYQPVLLLALASTVRKCSNMNDGMILAARRSNIKDIPQRTRSDVFYYFQFYCEKAIDALAEWYALKWDNSSVKQVLSNDARDLKGDWKCDAVITSPPYINAIDYIWASKFELHWLGLVNNDQERLDLYSKEIGTERISSAEYQQIGKTGNYELDQLIEKIFFGEKYKASKGQNELRARVVYKYFIV